jgi:hypothetical protein
LAFQRRCTVVITTIAIHNTFIFLRLSLMRSEREEA